MTSAYARAWSINPKERLRVHLCSAQTVTPFCVNRLQEVLVIMSKRAHCAGNRFCGSSLDKVTLIEREMVRFFAACDVRNIELRNCPDFIREWKIWKEWEIADKNAAKLS